MGLDKRWFQSSQSAWLLRLSWTLTWIVNSPSAFAASRELTDARDTPRCCQLYMCGMPSCQLGTVQFSRDIHNREYSGLQLYHGLSETLGYAVFLHDSRLQMSGTRLFGCYMYGRIYGYILSALRTWKSRGLQKESHEVERECGDTRLPLFNIE